MDKALTVNEKNEPTQANELGKLQDALSTVTEGDLVRALRGERSLRDFADYLNQGIFGWMQATTTHQSVMNWENGVYPVALKHLMAWESSYAEKDPRHQLAVDILNLRKGNFQAHWVSPTETKAEGGMKNAEVQKGKGDK